MSACWKVTLVKPASCTRRCAAASDSSEMSMEVKAA